MRWGEKKNRESRIRGVQEGSARDMRGRESWGIDTEVDKTEADRKKGRGKERDKRRESRGLSVYPFVRQNCILAGSFWN